eukprot:GHVP01024186.1.p1 GENE.GHVP01024186.1~~GHVP01024186.1.p1  ORF type:complete len:2011 (-),score=317.95 GHVP01024186.1:3954-9986(-)
MENILDHLADQELLENERVVKINKNILSTLTEVFPVDQGGSLKKRSLQDPLDDSLQDNNNFPLGNGFVFTDNFLYRLKTELEESYGSCLVWRSGLPADQFQKNGGWLAILLKVHQLLLPLLNQEYESCGKENFLINSFEAKSIYSSIIARTRLSIEQTGKDFQCDLSSNDTNKTDLLGGYDLYIKLVNGLWVNWMKSIVSEDNTSKQEKLSSGIYCGSSEKKKAIVIAVDVDVISFCLEASGRYDAYAWCLFCLLLKPSLEETKFKVVPPKFLLGSWDMVTKRARHGLRVISDSEGKFNLNDDRYNWYLTLLTSGSKEACMDSLADVENDIWHLQFNKMDQAGFHRIEKLLVALLGSDDDVILKKAIILLNVLYDRHDWQAKEAFLPIVSSVGDPFGVEIKIWDSAHPDKSKPEGIFLILSAPTFCSRVNVNVYSYHDFTWTPGPTTRNEGAGLPRFRIAGKRRWIGKVNFGSFPRCGFYDWRVVRADSSTGSWETLQVTMSELRRTSSSSSTSSRNLTELFQNRFAHEDDDDEDFTKTFSLQGRFIVQPRGMNQEQVHEVFVDQHDARWDSKSGELVSKGSFSSVAASLEQFKRDGISSLYLMGALARDHGNIMFTSNGDVVYERPDASPFAVTSRSTPNQPSGGVQGFLGMMREAKRVGIRVMVDCFARISSSGMHRKYYPYGLHTIDEQGKLVRLYGTEGRAKKFSETCNLNYRRAETWESLVEDIKLLANRMGVDGVRCDSAYLWPIINIADHNELNRLDADGVPHYNPEQIIMGDVVLPYTAHSCGYWNSEASARWPNPLLTRLCRDIWEENPNFLIVAECATGEDFNTRADVLARSGTVPQLQELPHMLCKLLNKQLDVVTGKVTDCQMSVPQLKEWFETTHQGLPTGAFVLQSSCSHTSPLPALMYGKGAWPAIDILMTMPDIPLTFGGEVEGKSYRLDSSNLFKISTQDSPVNCPDENLISVRRKIGRVSSMTNLTSGSRQPVSPSILGGPSDSTDNTVEGPMTVRTYDKFKPFNQFEKMESEHAKSLKSGADFDLAKINEHYKKLRSIRRAYKIFGDSLLVPLQVMKDEHPVNNCLSFARLESNTRNFVLVVANFSDNHLNAAVSCKALKRMMSTLSLDGSSMYETFDIHSDPAKNYFKEELSCDKADVGVIGITEALNEPYAISLGSFKSTLIGFKLVTKERQNQTNFIIRLYISSLQRFERIGRTIRSMKMKGEHVLPDIERSVNSNFVAITIQQFISQAASGKINFLKLSETVSLLDGALEKMQPSERRSIYEMIVDSSILDGVTSVDPSGCDVDITVKNPITKLHPISKSTVFLTLMKCLKVKGSEVAWNFAKQVLNRQQMSPIVFVTAECGAYCTVGGLGVMIDELATTLAQEFGQEVWVILPLYEKTANDPRMKDKVFEYLMTIKLHFGNEEIPVYVHEIKNDRGVRFLFFKNPKYFATPYQDHTGSDSLRMLGIYGKAPLEILCQLKSIPPIVVTNDWTSGLVAAYGKTSGHFGQTFSNTTFMHILHNMDPDYEGRIFPDKREDISWVLGLPNELLIDPMWHQFVYNPSRCALLSTDSWGTVSKSYRDDLRGYNSPSVASPLSGLLNRFPNPFAHPNGIFVEKRVATLNALKCESHIEAKGRLQTKYFGFQTPDTSIPLFAFIGRVTRQKGVHLIVEAAENLIKRYNYRVQILVGGPVNWRDAYSASCGHRMRVLRERFGSCFWCDTDNFFYDGALVNIGADFGLMPSLFEPGGIVQQEFFVAGTPVVAFKTGGLKDTVFEFNRENQTGNGFNFETYNAGDLLYALERAYRIYCDPPKYEKLRKNCFESVISSFDVAEAWLGEFCRLRRELPFNKVHSSKFEKFLLRQQPKLEDKAAVRKRSESLPFDPSMISISTGSPDKKSSDLKPKTQPVDKTLGRGRGISSSSATPVRLRYIPADRQKHRVVAISGSFDEWSVRRPMSWDNASQAFIINLGMPSGKHYYKLIVDGDWMVNPSEAKEIDSLGNENNIVIVE